MGASCVLSSGASVTVQFRAAVDVRRHGFALRSGCAVFLMICPVRCQTTQNCRGRFPKRQAYRNSLSSASVPMRYAGIVVSLTPGPAADAVCPIDVRWQRPCCDRRDRVARLVTCTIRLRRECRVVFGVDEPADEVEHDRRAVIRATACNAIRMVRH